MRPRRLAAEYVGLELVGRDHGRCFNEAAAISRGIQALRGRDREHPARLQ